MNTARRRTYCDHGRAYDRYYNRYSYHGDVRVWMRSVGLLRTGVLRLGGGKSSVLAA